MASSDPSPAAAAAAAPAPGGHTHTHLRLYLHDTLTGAKPTAVRVVRGPEDTEPINFGDVLVIDDPLTEGPEPESRLVARAQGFYVRASIEGLILQINANLVFLEGGEYAGSTLVVAGANPLLTAEEREYAVVGGSGRFRGARGYVLEKTVVMDPTTGDGVFQLDVHVDN